MTCAWCLRVLLALMSFAGIGIIHVDLAHAWGAGPAAVKFTNAMINQVGSCSDGQNGTLIVWTEQTQIGLYNVLGQHLLADGSLDPAWPPTGTLVAGGISQPTRLEAVPDHSGGMYPWWIDTNRDIYITRLEPNGTRLPQWPPGRWVGTGGFGLPSVISDGGDGVFMTWSGSSGLELIHLGPLNTGDGWPEYTFNPFGALNALFLWPHLAVSPDSGVYIAVGDALPPSYVVGEWRLQRLASGGMPAPGWPSSGRVIGSFDFLLLEQAQSFDQSLTDICPDGRGGVFLHTNTPYAGSPGYIPLEARVRRITNDGTPAPDWPAGGVLLNYVDPLSYEQSCRLSGAGVRALSDGQGAAVTGYYVGGADASNDMFFYRCAGGGCSTADRIRQPEYELATSGNGMVWDASYEPHGPTCQFYCSDAFLRVAVVPAPTGWPGWWSEDHFEPAILWYGDISISATEDGGAVFLWSQVYQLHGLFARRFSPAGLVTAVEAPPATTALALRHARFVRGEGVRARMSVPAGATATLTLFDIAGRRRAEESLPGGIDRDVTLAGTASLPAGVYFVAARAGGDRASDRVVVIP